MFENISPLPKSKLEKSFLYLNVIAKVIFLVIALGINEFQGDDHHHDKVVMDYVQSQGSTVTRLLSLFAKWDGMMFVQIAIGGYTNLKLNAFFPGYPTLVKTVVNIAVPSSLRSDKEAFFSWFVSIGVILNVLMHLANNLYIYRYVLITDDRLSKMLGRSERVSSIIGVVFAIGHSSYYHVLLYSESLFLFIYLTSILILFHFLLIQKKWLGDIAIWKLMLLAIYFSLNGFVRSTGFFSAAHICFPLLLELIYELSKSFKLTSKTIRLFLLIVVISCCFLFPMFYLQRRVYNTYCLGEASSAPAFCAKLIPDYYAFIQEQYWDVFLFAFYQKGLYSEGILMILSLVMWVYWIHKFVWRTCGGFMNVLIANIPSYVLKPVHSQDKFILFPFFASFTIIGMYSFMFANTCSVDRFFSSIPIFYIILGEFREAVRPYKWLRILFDFNLLTRFFINIYLYASMIQPA